MNFILLLAGSGTRLFDKIHVKKQFYKLQGKEMFLYPLKSAVETNLFSHIVLVIDKEDEEKVKKIVFNEFKDERFIFTYGGKDRNESVKNGLFALKGLDEADSYVFIHDSDRVLLSSNYIIELSKAIQGYDALTPVLALHDSILKAKNDDITYLSRDDLYLIQTPQVFSYKKILDIYENGYDPKDTDDFKKAVSKNLKVRIYPGLYENFKVTTIDELELIKRIFNR